MEPLSLTASIIAIASLTGQVFDVMQSTITKYKDAPDELQQLKCQVRDLGAIINLLSSLQQTQSFNVQFLDKAGIEELHECLRHTSETLLSIKEVFYRQSLQPRTYGRLKWALYREDQVCKWKSKLHQHFSSLNIIIALLTWHSVKELNVANSKSINNSEITTLQYVQRPAINALRSTYLSGHCVSAKQWMPPWLQKLVEIDFDIALFEAGRTTRYRQASIRLRLPLLLRYYMWCFDLIVWSRLSFRVPLELQRISIRHVIPADSEILKVCQNGDFLGVLELLLAGKAHWRDTTPDNYSPLRYAIQSGCSKAVAVLLNHGADASATFGQYSTSHLEWAFAFRHLDIARLLLRHGADIHYISSRGWTPAFNLFDREPSPDKQETAPTGDFLGFLVTNSFDAFDTYDGGGWTCLHRAAAFGVAQDIISLSKIKALMETKTRGLLWTPIFCAVLFDNEATFHELRKLQVDYLSITDVRGWTVLHLAAYAGSLNVIGGLVALGADPQARSHATTLFVPEALKNRALTAYELAIYHGEATSQFYEKCVEMKYPETDVRESMVPDEKDIFWPAAETWVS